MHLSPPTPSGLGCCLLEGGGFVVVDFLFLVTPIVGVCNCSMFCCTLLCVRSSIAIILMGKREGIALLNLSSWCLVVVERLFLPVPRGCLRFVIVVLPDHTRLLFMKPCLCHRVTYILFTPYPILFLYPIDIPLSYLTISYPYLTHTPISYIFPY